MHKLNRASILGTLVVSLGAAYSADASVIIQEVLYDGPGTDSDDVFTEIYGAPGTDLSGWSLSGINGSDGQVYRTIDLSGLTIPDDGILVIATSAANLELALERDFIANVDWQNGPDALHLLYAGQIMDALQYGDAGNYNAGEGAFALDVSGSVSLSRDQFGTDTNDNATDFIAAEPTPGRGPAVVPVPAAGWLLGSALGLLAAIRKRAVESRERRNRLPT